MQERKLYEYAVIRIVPKVEREEFFNAGIILYVHQTKQLLMRYTLDHAKLLCFCPEAASEEIGIHLDAFEKIAMAVSDSGPIGQLDAISRFRWLIAPRSTIVQTSRVHPGFCIDATVELNRLYELYVCG